MEDPTVYVVDDNIEVCDSLRFLLESAGYGVETFHEPDELLERLAIRAFGPGCLVADLRLPRMTGLEMHDELINRGHLIPTVMITGHGNAAVAVRAMKAGMIDFLEKPFADEALLGRVRHAVDLDGKWRAEQDSRSQVRGRYESLSEKEVEVMWAVVAGKLNKQIALEKKRSAKTIEVHRSKVMRKMKADSLPSLVRMAVLLEREPTDGRRRWTRRHG